METSRWKTFDTAPKDGSWILAYPRMALIMKNTCPIIVRWGQWMEKSSFCPDGSGKDCWRDVQGTKFMKNAFVYWHPLPPKPSPSLFDSVI